MPAAAWRGRRSLHNVTRRRIFLANLAAQMGIIVTGAVVRLTSSGLGCPTWPECVPGSIVPTATQTEAWHKYVEFGNRLLTVVLVVVAIATILAARGESQLVRRLSYGSLAGIFGQALLGGVTVLTGLHPLWVAAHFLLSIALVAAAALLVWQTQQPHHSPAPVPPVLRQAVRALTAVGLAVIVVGTLVTGTGPHAGDSADITRLPFDWRVISWLHADVAILFIGLAVGIAVAALAVDAPRQVVRAADTVIGVALAQGAIGYIQVFTHLPWGLVAAHVVGAVTLWVVTLRLRFSIA